MANVALAVLGDNFRLQIFPQTLSQQPRNLSYRGGHAGAHIYGVVICAFRLKRPEICLHDIADVYKVARLLAVFKNPRRLIVEKSRGEDGADAGVRIRESLSRPIHIEKAQRDGRDSVSAAKHQAKLFLVLLGDRIDGSRK